MAYQMINVKKASLFVIYGDKKPIGITLNYHSKDVLFEYLTVFDSDYYRFNIGHTTILKLLDWSFNNNVKIFDFSHGDFDYKKRWSIGTYSMSHHIIYDSSSIRSRFIAWSLKSNFYFKRYLREKNVIAFKKRLFFKAQHLFDKVETTYLNYKVSILEFDNSSNELEEIDLYSDMFTSQRKSFFDYIYGKPETVSSFTFFKKENGSFYASNENTKLLISLKS